MQIYVHRHNEMKWVAHSNFIAANPASSTCSNSISRLLFTLSFSHVLVEQVQHSLTHTPDPTTAAAAIFGCRKNTFMTFAHTTIDWHYLAAQSKGPSAFINHRREDDAFDRTKMMLNKFSRKSLIAKFKMKKKTRDEIVEYELAFDGFSGILCECQVCTETERKNYRPLCDEPIQSIQCWSIASFGSFPLQHRTWTLPIYSWCSCSIRDADDVPYFMPENKQTARWL